MLLVLARLPVHVGSVCGLLQGWRLVLYEYQLKTHRKFDPELLQIIRQIYVPRLYNVFQCCNLLKY